MMFKTTSLFVVLLTLTIIDVINGVGRGLHSERWKYCHEKAHIDGLDPSQICLNQYRGECKYGKNQSPINIVKDTRIEIKLNDPFRFTSSSDVFPLLKVENNGHSVQVTPRKMPYEFYTMSGGGLNGSYEFEQAHLHWGSQNGLGSEHTIDGKRYAMEMHLVFWNKKFDNATIAMESGESDALAVLAVLFKIDDKNKMLDPIFDIFKNVLQEKGQKDFYDFPVRGVIPKKRNKFYRYHGSLTTPTPDCNEVVVWTIFKEKLEISQKQMNELRQLQHGLEREPRTLISNNYRDSQPLNGRKVLYVKIKEDDDDDK